MVWLSTTRLSSSNGTGGGGGGGAPFRKKPGTPPAPSVPREEREKVTNRVKHQARRREDLCELPDLTYSGLKRMTLLGNTQVRTLDYNAHRLLATKTSFSHVLIGYLESQNLLFFCIK
ncbi:hypothetical protein E2C01_016980 [Portunus trituberculatus]|uniref:Uncharacterized protein n=1 Tax=Portunus trituberculatus TaxID=210409 RepID=A0A5B7DSD8_PORTR|nr:hypothetical protein [Portunus trituberculatus]